MSFVFDSSTLILLAKIEILRAVVEKEVVIIPGMVEKECLKKETFDARVIRTLVQEGKIRIEKVGARKEFTKLCKDFRIAQGEGEALYLAKLHGFPLAVDDGPTIKACKILGFPFTTGIHFLVNMVCCQEMSQSSAHVKLEKLSTYGRYNQRILQDAGDRIKEVP